MAVQHLAADRKKLEEHSVAKASKLLADQKAEIEEQRRLAQLDLQQGREICRKEFADVGMLRLAAGLRRAVAILDKDLEGELRLELGRYAPFLPRLVGMPWSSAAGSHGGVSLSRDGKRLIATGTPWGVLACDADAGRVGPFADKGPNAGGVAISPDGTKFANDHGLFDAATGKLLHKIDGCEKPNAFAPDGNRLLASRRTDLIQDRQSHLLLVDPATGQSLGGPWGLGRDTATRPHAFSPDSSLVAVTQSHIPGGVRRSWVQFWDAIKSERGDSLPAAMEIEALAFNPDSRLLATVSCEGPFRTDWSVRLWDVATGTQKGEYELLSSKSARNSLTFSRDGKALLVLDGNAGHLLLAVDKALPLWGLVKPGAVGIPLLASFSPDGKTIWTATDSGLAQWDAESGRFLAAIHRQWSNAMHWAFSADGRRVAGRGGREVGYYDSGKGNVQYEDTILVWDLPVPKPGEKAAPRRLAGAPELIHLWLQVQTGREIFDGEKVMNLSYEAWSKCREKFVAAGGLPLH